MNNLHGVEALLAVAQSGDKETENRLFSLLRARILELVQHRIWNTQRDVSEIRHDVENLTQEICLIILEKYKTETFDHGFMPWVFQIVRNKIGEYYRERDRKRGIEEIDVDDEGPQIANGSARTEQLAELHELDRMIRHALKKMNGRSRIIIKALLQDKIEAYIIEQRRTTKVDTIYGQISRCRTRFHELLRHEGFER